MLPSREAMFSMHCSSTLKASNKMSSSCVEVGVAAEMVGVAAEMVDRLCKSGDFFCLVTTVARPLHASATWQR